MFLDASAIVAILAREPDADEISKRLDAASVRLTSPVAVFEAALALARIGSTPVATTRQIIVGFLSDMAAEIVAIDEAVGDEAVAAFERYGKGRHPAGLNMGDCFAYACARRYQVPLLFKGDDFAATDIERA